MAVRKRFVNPFARREIVEGPSANGAPDIETAGDSQSSVDKSYDADRTSSAEVVIDEKAQAGTQKAQASTQAWTQNTLLAAYALYVIPS